MNLSRLVPIVVALAVSWSCSSSPSSTSVTTSPSSATVSSVAVSGGTILSSVGQTVQLIATATFSDGTTQNVTTTSTWQSSNSGAATVSSGGLVTAVATGTVTITATYQGKAGTATVVLSFASSSRSTMTAVIDGIPFSGITVLATKTGAIPNLPSGLLGVAGTSAFTSPYLVLDITIPAAVGTYSLGFLSVGSCSLSQNSTASVLHWGSGGSGEVGGSATVTLTTLTATGATGTFSCTLTPGAGVGGTPTGTKVVTNGAFNVTF